MVYYNSLTKIRAIIVINAIIKNAIIKPSTKFISHIY